MITYGIFREQLIDVLHAKSDDEMKLRIERETRYQYARLSKVAPWDTLRCASPETLDFSAASDTTGLFMPSDMIGIEFVWDDTNEVSFMEVGREDAQDDQWGWRYYTYRPSRSDLFAGTDLILSKGGSSFTSASLTADGTDPDGEFVVFDDELGVYEISSSTTPFTFTPTYYGEGKTQKPFRIRPWEITKKLVIVDEEETKLRDRSVDVYFWRLPPPLYRDQDIILIPAELLKLNVLRAIPQAKSLYPVSERMLTDAMAEAVRQNPQFPGVVSPRDKRGERYEMAKCPFKKR